MIKHDIYQLLPKLTETLHSERDIIFVYVFGSYGLNKVGPLGDVDIGIYFDYIDDDWDKKLYLYGIITSTLKTDEVDIVILNNTSVELAFNIIKTGKLLFCKDDYKMIRFFCTTLNRYFDTYWFRKWRWTEIIKRFDELKLV